MRMCMRLRNAEGTPIMTDQTNSVTTNSSDQVNGSLKT